MASTGTLHLWECEVELSLALTSSNESEDAALKDAGHAQPGPRRDLFPGGAAIEPHGLAESSVRIAMLHFCRVTH